jgi:COPI associated protein
MHPHTVTTPPPNDITHCSKGKIYVYGLSILNMGLACMMGALGVLAILEFKPSLGQFTDTLLAIYLIIFAALLFAYELIWWQPLPLLNRTFRKNFGFLYGLYGKGFYLIFTALLTIGFIRDDKAANSVVPSLDWITGIACLASGVLHLFVACQMPDVKAAYVPPKSGYENGGSGGDEVNGNYRNPV